MQSDGTTIEIRVSIPPETAAFLGAEASAQARSRNIQAGRLLALLVSGMKILTPEQRSWVERRMETTGGQDLAEILKRYVEQAMGPAALPPSAAAPTAPGPTAPVASSAGPSAQAPRRPLRAR